MKKALPAIVVLISLSLLGLILLQVSWFNTLLAIRTSQLRSKATSSATRVTTDLYKNINTSPVFKLKKRLSPNKLKFQLPLLILPPTVEERYSLNEVSLKLKNEFEKDELYNLKYEFAIINSNEEYEMYTPSFQQKMFDTLHNISLLIPIVPETVAEFEETRGYETFIIIIPDFKDQVWASLKWVIFGAGIFSLVIIAAFYVTLKTLYNQKKLAEIKSDFINNMTHEFKTPLATISLAVDAIKNEKVQNDKAKLGYFTGIIKEENLRMNKHVETILQAALLEKEELKMQFVPIHVHETLQNVIDNYVLQLEDKGGKVELLLNAKTDCIQADEVHFTNMLSNLIDNAIKYSNDNVLLKIITHSTSKHFVCSIQDNGIGMSKESVKRIFEKFYRAHTGNVHNVKGFGLGMSYVKTVVDAHNGKIKVDSTMGKGTTFTLELPLENKG